MQSERSGYNNSHGSGHHPVICSIGDARVKIVSGAQFVFRFGVLNTNIKTFVCGVYFKESLSVKNLFDSCPNIKFLNAELLSWLFLYCTFIYCHTKARFFFLSFPEAYISRPSSSTSRNLTNIFGYSIRFNT